MTALCIAPRTSSDAAEELDDDPFVDCGGGNGCWRIVTPESTDVAMI